MKYLACTVLFLLIFPGLRPAWTHDEPLPGGGPRSEQGQHNSQRPLSHPGRKALHTEKGRLTGGGQSAATGGPFSAHNVEFLSRLSLADMGADGNVRGNDIWGWTDPLDGREYALVGRSDGTAFVDVTDPLSPVYLGFLGSHTGNTAWRDIKVYADHAYVVSDNNGSHGMQVFDLTQLRAVVAPPVSFSETSHYAGFSEGHNIAINEATGFAYVVGSETYSGGLHFIDITNPVNPVAAGGFGADGYTHDAQVVSYAGPDTVHSGREVAFNCNEDTLTIVDVTDKNSPIQLSRTGYPRDAYTHQGWLTEDHAYFLSNDELDEYNDNTVDFTRTHIWDVSDLDAPVYLGYYEAAVASIDHNLYVHNGLVYEANYTTGLRVLEHAEIASGKLSEVAFIDTHPGKDSLRSFDGAWSNYPFFGSGTVIIGDRDEGLIVVRVLRADLAVSGTGSPDPVVEDFMVTYTFDMVNNGPDPASNVTLTDPLPAGVIYVQAVSSQGSCSEAAGSVTCLIGTLANGASATVTVTVTANTPGSLNNEASASADEVDGNAADNVVTLGTTVLPDMDGDGLDDGLETAIGTSALLPDTDGDGVSDYEEVGFDGDASAYTGGQDMNPLLADTDGDLLDDAADPLPLLFNYGDGDLAPLGAPDGLINVADLLVGIRIVSGAVQASDLERSHGDLYPAAAPDGVINLSDLVLLQQRVLNE